jgi:hypothetical protein
MWLISGRFTVCGYQTPELDLTPVLGVGFIVTVVYSLMLHTPVGG